MRSLAILVLIGIGSQLTTTAVWAHHAFSAEFDVDRPIQLHGTLVKWEMINPHSWFHIAVKDEAGNETVWMIEGGSPNQLVRLGVTKNTLQVGTALVVDGYQAKDGSNKGVGRDFRCLGGGLVGTYKPITSRTQLNV